MIVVDQELEPDNPAFTTISAVYRSINFHSQFEAKDVSAVIDAVQALVDHHGTDRAECREFILGVFNRLVEEKGRVTDDLVANVAASLLWLACNSEPPYGQYVRTLATAGGGGLRYMIEWDESKGEVSFDLHVKPPASMMN